MKKHHRILPEIEIRNCVSEVMIVFSLIGQLLMYQKCHHTMQILKRMSCFNMTSFPSLFLLQCFSANIQVHYNLDSSFDSQILLPCEIARKNNYHPFQKHATTQREREFKPLFPCSLLSVTTFYQLT
jgi:hypothetical protein